MKIFKTLAVVGALLGAGTAYAFMPQAGTWIVTSENNGQPGRGFGLDVQETTLVMQMYAYEANGSPTFYLSAGAISNNRFSAPLNEYRGGRHLGGGDRSGTQTGTAGNVSMRFESGTKGYITFPGEPEKEISRYNFAYSASPASLRGIWLFSPLNTTTPTSDFVQLSSIHSATTDGNGLVMSTDGRMGCEHQVSGGAAGTVVCARITTTGKLERGYSFTYSVNDGEGIYINGAGSATSIAVMRRLGNAAGTGTGVLIKNKAESELSDTAQVDMESMRTQIEALAAQVQDTK